MVAFDKTMASMALVELEETLSDRIEYFIDFNNVLDRSARALSELAMQYEAQKAYPGGYDQRDKITAETWLDTIKKHAPTLEIQQSILARSDLPVVVFNAIRSLTRSRMGNTDERSHVNLNNIELARVPTLSYDEALLIEAYSRSDVSVMLRENYFNQFCQDRKNINQLLGNSRLPQTLRSKLFDKMGFKKTPEPTRNTEPALVRSSEYKAPPGFIVRQEKEMEEKHLRSSINDPKHKGQDLLKTANRIIETGHDEWNAAMLRVSADPGISIDQWNDFVSSCGRKKPEKHVFDKMLEDRLSLVTREGNDKSELLNFLKLSSTFKLYIKASPAVKAKVESFIIKQQPTAASLDETALKDGANQLLVHLHPVEKVPLSKESKFSGDYLAYRVREVILKPALQLLMLKNILPFKLQDAIFEQARMRGAGDYALAMLSSQPSISPTLKGEFISTQSHWVASEFKRHHHIALPLINDDFYNTRDGMSMVVAAEQANEIDSADPTTSLQREIQQAFRGIDRAKLEDIKDALSGINPDLSLDKFVPNGAQQAIKKLLEEELSNIPEALSLVQVARKMVKSVLLELPESLAMYLSVSEFASEVNKKLGDSDWYVKNPENQPGIANEITSAMCQLIRREKMLEQSVVVNKTEAPAVADELTKRYRI